MQTPLSLNFIYLKNYFAKLDIIFDITKNIFNFFQKLFHFSIMTFKDYYQQAKNEQTAAQKFIAEIARITGRTEISIRKWLSGENVPENETKQILAEHFDVPANELFPPTPQKKSKKNKKSPVRRRKGGRK